MKEKLIVGIIAVIVLIGAIFTAVMIKKDIKKEEIQEKIVAEIPLEDECIEEYRLVQEETRVVNSTEDKIASNSILILKKDYKECGHTINEYVDMLPELVNMTQDEVEEEFKEWDLIGFSSQEVTLLKEINENCGEHFSLKEENGKVVIYKTSEDGTEQVYEKTEISTEFLPETDLMQMQSEEGIKVYGLEELNKILEDFE